MGAFRRYNTSSRDSSYTSPPPPPPPISNLQDLLDHYQHEPDLLKIILRTKVEEDRRKAEEARLLVKQLDYCMSLHKKTTPVVFKQQQQRRSMQPVTRIIETKDSHYKDTFLWKNNGKTTHKKTGWKSTYYKCANANKGCPVNKTVNVSGKGDYIIKYRGHHLSCCDQIERICDL
ncbi:hypothetical protein BC941DRAFT_517245 [Chlamydoabsidia padenii]|nr:hypothetical protein BC941DRAFT_517245 [Chlamydoabsidia padenii]